HWMTEAVQRCAMPSPPPLKRGELINYHLSLDLGFLQRVWPDLDPHWPGFAACGRSDTAIFRRLSAIDILDAIQAGGDLSHDLLCQ
ncbi:hypothetical protein Q8G41_28210, partial [Klebsiella pneumoniae]|uniref:hypothetical protein n=1 Tax=Klebsiella pneumoniae TaxID=573 RepID=UPI00301361CB